MASRAQRPHKQLSNATGQRFVGPGAAAFRSPPEAAYRPVTHLGGTPMDISPANSPHLTNMTPQMMSMAAISQVNAAASSPRDQLSVRLAWKLSTLSHPGQHGRLVLLYNNMIRLEDQAASRAQSSTDFVVPYGLVSPLTSRMLTSILCATAKSSIDLPVTGRDCS